MFGVDTVSNFSTGVVSSIVATVIVIAATVFIGKKLTVPVIVKDELDGVVPTAISSIEEALGLDADYNHIAEIIIDHSNAATHSAELMLDILNSQITELRHILANEPQSPERDARVNELINILRRTWPTKKRQALIRVKKYLIELGYAEERIRIS